jgi:GTPase SAR1 family protein
VCFAVNNPTSFKNIKGKWIDEIRSHAPKTPFILVGTKADTRELAESSVSKAEAQALCDELKGKLT